jgi:hypothetical protein
VLQPSCYLDSALASSARLGEALWLCNLAQDGTVLLIMDHLDLTCTPHLTGVA